MEISILEIFQIIFKKMWILILSSILCLVVGLSVSLFLIAPKYTSKAQLYVNPNAESEHTSSNLNDLQYSQRLVNSYLIILKNNVFLQNIADNIGLDYTAEQIESMLNLSAVNNTEIFEVSVITNIPSHSYTIVNTILELAPNEIIRVRQFDTVKVVSPASFPDSPSSPNVVLNSVIGFILGLLVSAGIVILVETLDTRIKSEKDLTDKLEIPILGIIPIHDN